MPGKRVSSRFRGRKLRLGRRLLFYTPLEGLEVCVLFHPDPTLRCLCGVVLLEKARCIVVGVEDRGRLCVLKKGGLFLFNLEPLGWLLVRGEELVGVVSERLRRLERGKGVKGFVRPGEKYRRAWCRAAGNHV